MYFTKQELKRIANNSCSILSLVLFVNLICGLHGFAQEDLREYQHGIDFIAKGDGTYWLIWSSSGNPPSGAAYNGNWTHDIYYSLIDPANPSINPKIIISKDEAQEPASSAINSDGNILITNEDGWNAKNTIAQRYGVYDNNLNSIKPYPNMVLDGGHSGHVAAVGSKFVIFYSEGWVDGGGVDNLGTGDDVLLKVYNSTGDEEKSRNVSVGSSYRDWWPLVAGSTCHALLLWQRFIDGEKYVKLMYSVYDPASDRFIRGNTELVQQVLYYTYDVQYIPSINRFIVIGTYKSGGGFAYLLDNSGNITGVNANLPGIVREAQPAIKNMSNEAFVVYPKQPNGLSVLRVTNSQIILNDTIPDSYLWEYIGTDGIFIDENSVYFVSLSKYGCKEKVFHNVTSTTGMNINKLKTPSSFELGQNYPNPFNSITKIPYYLSHNDFVSLSVYNLKGDFIDTLVNGESSAGEHEVIFSGKRLASGIYYYQLKIASGLVKTRKLLLLK